MLKKIMKNFILTITFISCLMVFRPAQAWVVVNPLRTGQAGLQFVQTAIRSGSILSLALNISKLVGSVNKEILGGLETNPEINTEVQAGPAIDQTKGYVQYSATSSVNKKLNNPDTFGAQLSAYQKPSKIPTKDKYGSSNKNIGSYSTTNFSSIGAKSINTEDSDKASKQVVANLTNQNVGIPSLRKDATATPATIKFNSYSKAYQSFQSTSTDQLNESVTNRQAIDIGGKTTSGIDNAKRTSGVTEAANENMNPNRTIGSVVAGGLQAMTSMSKKTKKLNSSLSSVGNLQNSINGQITLAEKPKLEGQKLQAENEQPGALNNETGR